MYVISNKQRDEITKLLWTLRELPVRDTRTANIKRMSLLMIKGLGKAKFIPHEEVKQK